MFSGPVQVEKKKPESERPAFVRVELQATPEWADELDAAAQKLGLTRSAFIRMACNLQIMELKNKFPDKT